jgi:hypothetical protein
VAEFEAMTDEGRLSLATAWKQAGEAAGMTPQETFVEYTARSIVREVELGEIRFVFPGWAGGWTVYRDTLGVVVWEQYPAPDLVGLMTEAEEAARLDPVARHDLAYLTPERIAGAATTRANLAAQEAEATRPLTSDEAAQLYAINKEAATRLGYETVADYLNATDPVGSKPPDAGKPTITIGTRTALDLACGSPPDQLAGPFLTPEGATIVYGKGGVGKGVLACFLIKQVVEAGHVVLVVDFEGHEREWGSRLRGLGLTDDQLGHIHYRAPFGDDWTARRGSLSDVAQLLRDDRDRVAATLLVVDSYTAATSTGDTMGGSPAAQEYFGALALIGVPSLTIAHVRGDSPRFADRPFGSVFVHNLARETWAVEQTGDDDDSWDPDLAGVGPHVVPLELRNKKANSRPKSPAQFVTFSFFLDGTIEATQDVPAGRSVADQAADVLVATPGLTSKAIVAAIKEDAGRAVSEEVVNLTLRRDARRFVADKAKRPYRWTIR